MKPKLETTTVADVPGFAKPLGGVIRYPSKRKAMVIAQNKETAFAKKTYRVSKKQAGMAAYDKIFSNGVHMEIAEAVETYHAWRQWKRQRFETSDASIKAWQSRVRSQVTPHPRFDSDQENPKLSVPDQHRMRVVKQSIKMPKAMRGVMGGGMEKMSVAQLRAILASYRKGK